ncbi:tRNA(Ile)-lysidine synthetase [Weissella oryzae SG25]|uniref:tRNA(Ile)-lysidine synthase n=1 Tax=Weissella oryzae (strain DSM 25784 / JCM 18191 / LMG 30913 / SG25) TaxID=1329250 RepID=A0A069CWC2_WEIOS|nr:tRNA lysidine(34) synthetase TilS [Weissella oryzae]GAK31754.1 tRNA(Ile)-lysidine synthetase [Weissella oryzae SG25]
MRARVTRANLIQQVRSEQLFDKNDHILVAFSGGYDSLHLLHWLTDGTLPADIQPRVSGLYVNHQLRADYQLAKEEQLVRETFDQLADKLVTSKVVRLDWQEKPQSAVEEQARERRYAELADFAQTIGSNKIATAHHQGDQIETILYKLIRGGQAAQLQGMSSCQVLAPGIEIIRPFLDLQKAQLPDLLKEPITEWIEDDSNQDINFARNRLRQKVLPELNLINQKAGANIVRLSQQIATLMQLAQPELNRQVAALKLGDLAWQQDSAVLVLILQSWLNGQGVFDIKDRQLAQAVKMMQNKSTAHGEVLLSNGRALIKNYQTLKLQITK